MFRSFSQIRRAARDSKVAPVNQPSDAGWIADDRYSAWVTFMLFAMFYYMSVPAGIFEGAAAADLVQAPLDPVYRVLKVSLLVAAALVIVWRYALAGPVLKRVNFFLLAFVALVGISIGWSITPTATATRLAAVIDIALVCMSFTLVGWHARRFQNVMRPILTILLVASLIFGILAPSLAKESGDGLSLKDAWHGIFTQKNQFGEVASLGVLFWLHGWLAKEVKFFRFLIGCGISAVCLFLSRSSTAILSTMFAVILLLLMLRRSGKNNRYTKFMVIVFVSALILYALAALKLVSGLDFLLSPIGALTGGKDATFSGRAAIWTVIRARILQHPWIGTGYGGFWIDGTPSSPSYFFLKLLYGIPNESHNGYLDIINDLGVVGLICFLGYLLVYMRQSLAMLRLDFAQAALFLALMFQQLLENLTESMWFVSSSFAFVVMTLATFSIARTNVQLQLEGTPQPAAAPWLRQVLERGRPIPRSARLR